MKISILGHRSCFTRHLHPIRVFRKELLECGIETSYFQQPLAQGIENCDALIFFEGSYRKILPIKNLDRNSSVEFLGNFFSKFKKVFWFDDHDSSGNLRSYIFPLVNVYLKAQTLKDTSYYQNNHLTGVLHRDYVNEHFNVNEPMSFKGPINDSDLKKMNVGWNLAMNNWLYNNTYSSMIGELVVRGTKNYRIKYSKNNFLRRNLDISYRGNLWQNFPTVSWWRSTTQDKLNSYTRSHPKIRTASIGTVSKKKFHEELRNSIITLSPFGIGEICYRDFEAFINGSLLFKPNMDHLITWPDLYQDSVTYVSYKWDFSDFEEKLEDILSHPVRFEEIAKEGQKRFCQSLTDGQAFGLHFHKMLSEN